MDKTKTFKINTGNEKEIILLVPQDIEMTAKEASMLAHYHLQEQIIAGNVEVSERRWPCLFCDKSFLSQTELLVHIETKEHRRNIRKFKHINDRFSKKESNDVNDQR